MDRAQVRAARALLGWSQEDLAKASGVSVPTLKRIEPGSGPVKASDEVISKIESAIRHAGIAFIGSERASESGGFGVRLVASDEAARLRLLIARIVDASDAIETALGLSRSAEISNRLHEAISKLDAASELVAEELRYHSDFEGLIGR